MNTNNKNNKNYYRYHKNRKNHCNNNCKNKYHNYYKKRKEFSKSEQVINQIDNSVEVENILLKNDQVEEQKLQEQNVQIEEQTLNQQNETQSVETVQPPQQVIQQVFQGNVDYEEMDFVPIKKIDTRRILALDAATGTSGYAIYDNLVRDTRC